MQVFVAVCVWSVKLSGKQQYFLEWREISFALENYSVIFQGYYLFYRKKRWTFILSEPQGYIWGQKIVFGIMLSW